MGANYIDPTDPRLDGRSDEERKAGIPLADVPQQRVDPAAAKEAARIEKDRIAAEAAAAKEAAAAAAEPEPEPKGKGKG